MRPVEAFLLADDLRVRRLGFGAMHVTGPGVWGEPRDAAGAVALLRRVVELGINLIDTADAYGPEISERLIADALHPYPLGLVIATKGGYTRPRRQWVPDGSPEHLKRSCEASLKRLRLDRIDLYQLHTPDPKVPFEESIAALAELLKQGKIRHIGVSNVTVEQLKLARTVAPICSVQNHYNLRSRASEPVLKYCEQHGLGFIPYFPLAFGNLSRNNRVLNEIATRHGATVSQIALAWLLKRSPVMLPIPGTSNVAHLEENSEASTIDLEDSDFEKLEAWFHG